MNSVRAFLTLVLFLNLCAAGGQEVPLSIQVRCGNIPLRLRQAYQIGTDTFRFEKVRFYLSHIRLQYQGRTVAQDEIPVHLIDLEDSNSCHWKLSVPGGIRYDAISMLVGTDSLSNVSGAKDGALDPAMGMYWTWQSGYINIKVEGYTPRCPARRNKFQFHIGGYQGVTASAQLWSAKTPSAGRLHLVLDMNEWMSGMSIDKTFEVMSPSEAAVRLAAQFAHAISLQP